MKKMIEDPYNLDARHTAAEYERALKACLPLLQDDRLFLRMLKAHYNAPDRTLTASELARQVGLKSYIVVNLNYGRLAAVVAKQLGHTPGQLEGVGVPVTVNIAVLVSFSGGKGKPTKWRLLPAVARALKRLDWV